MGQSYYQGKNVAKDAHQQGPNTLLPGTQRKRHDCGKGLSSQRDSSSWDLWVVSGHGEKALAPTNGHDR